MTFVGVDTAAYERVRADLERDAGLGLISFTIHPDSGTESRLLEMRSRTFTVDAEMLTDDDGSQALTDSFVFPDGARLINSYVTRVAMTGASQLAPARIQGADGPTFALVDGQTFVAEVNGSPATVTFEDGTYSYFEPSADEPYSLGTTSWFVRLNNGPQESVDFLAADFANPAEATAAEVIARLNIHFAGRAVAAPSGDKWRLTSNMIGVQSSVTSSGGFVPWAFDAGTSSSTGTSVDVTATTLDEVKNALEFSWGSSGLSVDITGGSLNVRTVGNGSSNTIEVQAHTAAALGFEVGEYTGTDATTASIDFGVGSLADRLADGMNLLVSGDGRGTGTNAVPTDAIDLSGLSLRATVVSNEDVSELAPGGGSASVTAVYVV
jgi:hypothetical protein